MNVSPDRSANMLMLKSPWNSLLARKKSFYNNKINIIDPLTNLRFDSFQIISIIIQ